MLATMLVTDLGDGSLASLAGDGQLSLREAVEAINTASPIDSIGPIVDAFGSNDTILFDAALFGGSSQTLTLAAGQLELTSGVTILGAGSNLLTIDAQQSSRIFNIAAGSDDYVIALMTLTGGRTVGVEGQGGAIRSDTSGQLDLRSAVLSMNVTTGGFSTGGAVSAWGQVTLVDSRIIDNRTENSGGGGGGVFSLGDISLLRSTVADNTTEGAFSSGGGVSSNGSVTLHSSTISGNRTLGSASSAGGILAVDDVDLTESTVSGNSTAGNTSSGGGVSSEGTITVTRSTIVDNWAQGASATGGGLQTVTKDVLVSGSIIANNLAGGGNADIQPGTGTLTVDHSLVGDTIGLVIAAATNLLNQNPLLGPLAENGGPTQTHAPMLGSPVIDAGDALFASPPVFDQRGVTFVRIADGDGNGSAVIDLGSYEVAAPATESADFDDDGDVDGTDFLAWQRGFGINSGATQSDGDADSDFDVDAQDLGIWQTQFGGVAPLANATAPHASAADRASLIDLAIALEFDQNERSDFDFASMSQPVAVADSSSREQTFAETSSGGQVAAASVEALTNEQASQKLADGYEGLDDELVDEAL